MDELYIDGEQVDLGKGTKVGITMQVNNIAEMEDRQGNFSNTFKTPKTKTNKAIYEHAELVNSLTEKPYRKLPAKYVQDGIELVSAGYCEFKSAGDFYEQTIFAGILDFFSQIKGKKLKDLDLSDYDHTWDIATVFASRVNTSGYIYALIDFNDDSETAGTPYMGVSTRNVDVRTLFPAMFIHTLIEKIFEGTSYSIAGDVASTSKYLNRLFPFQLDKLEYDDDFVTAKLFKAQLTADQVFYSAVATPGFSAYTDIIINDDSSAGYFDNSGGFDVTLGEFIIPVSGVYTFTLDTIVSMTGTSCAYQTRIYIVGGADIGLNGESVGVPFTNRTLTTTSTPQAFAAGTKIRTRINYLSLSAYTATVKAGTVFKNSLEKQILFNGDIFMSGMMPDMTQEELLKSVANQLGIIFVPDNIKKIIYFKQIRELYANKPNAVNMTGKLDMKSEIKVSFRESNYAQKNWLRYKENTNNTVSGIVPTKGLGDGYFFVRDENLEAEKDLFTLPFSATDDVARLNGLSVCRIPKLNAGVFANKTQLRMVMLNRQDITGGNVTYLTYETFPPAPLSSSTSIPLTYFIDDTKNDSLGFDRFLISVEYNEFINLMLNNFKKVEGKFKLDIKDVHNFDFFIPWTLDQYQNDFYVNKIKDFVKGQLTSVELIRM